MSVPGIKVIGSPLFSYIPKDPSTGKPLESAMWSYTKLLHSKPGVVPLGVSCDDLNAFHSKCKSRIIKELVICKQKDQKAILVTHFSPLAPRNTRELRDAVFTDPARYGDYCTDDDMQEVLDHGKGVIEFWVYGHDHANNRFRYKYPDGTGFDLVSNQLGSTKYPNDRWFNPEYTRTVKIDKNTE